MPIGALRTSACSSAAVPLRGSYGFARSSGRSHGSALAFHWAAMSCRRNKESLGLSMISSGLIGRKQTFEDAVLKATRESASSGSPRYIHHRADGEFAVFAYSTVGTVAVAHPDGTLRRRTERGL